MSSGAFTLSKYESNAGNIYPIRVQPETIAATIGGANAAPTGAVDQEVSARANGSARQIGMNARTVSVRLTAELPGYKADSVLRIPILTPARWDAINKGQTGTYLNTACVVVGKSPERAV